MVIIHIAQNQTAAPMIGYVILAGGWVNNEERKAGKRKETDVLRFGWGGKNSSYLRHRRVPIIIDFLLLGTTSHLQLFYRKIASLHFHFYQARRTILQYRPTNSPASIF